MKNKKTFALISLFSTLLLLAGCGVKPPYLDPPEGVEHDTFPETYPDLSTDPKPGLENRPNK